MRYRNKLFIIIIIIIIIIYYKIILHGEGAICTSKWVITSEIRPLFGKSNKRLFTKWYHSIKITYK